MAARRKVRAKRAGPSPSQPPSRSGTSRAVGWLLLGCAGLVVFLAALGAMLSVWARTSRGGSQVRVTIRVEARRATAELAEGLAELGAVDSAWLMRLYLTTLGRMGELQLGRHLLPENASPRVIAQCLSRAPSRPSAEVLIPEGFDHVRVARRLEERGVCLADEFIALVRDKSAIAPLGITGPDAEGYLFPATYRLPIDSAAADLLARFVGETRARLRRVDERLGGGQVASLASTRNFGEHEILTMASIIEKEAKFDEERPLIASVFYNRLDSASFRPRRMLQSDPTAAYGCLVQRERIPSCQEFQQRVLPAMLRDSANPYNTYKHPGLPPGPIASPGEASISAVLSPASTSFFFFVATGDGRHSFSKDLDEHNARLRDGTPRH